MYKAAKPAIGKKVTGSAGSVGKRTLNRIYKKNTGESSRTRNARVRKYK